MVAGRRRGDETMAWDRDQWVGFLLFILLIAFFVILTIVVAIGAGRLMEGW